MAITDYQSISLSVSFLLSLSHTHTYKQTHTHSAVQDIQNQMKYKIVYLKFKFWVFQRGTSFLSIFVFKSVSFLICQYRFWSLIFSSSQKTHFKEREWDMWQREGKDCQTSTIDNVNTTWEMEGGRGKDIKVYQSYRAKKCLFKRPLRQKKMLWLFSLRKLLKSTFILLGNIFYSSFNFHFFITCFD